MGDSYPCLSIRQPWVWAIFHAGKDIENRDWPTRFRGRCLIHASASMTRAEYDGFVDWATRIGVGAIPAREDLPRGVLYGGVRIADCVEAHPSEWFAGRYGFVLAGPTPLPKPIPYKGRLGFFQVPASAIREGE